MSATGMGGPAGRPSTRASAWASTWPAGWPEARLGRIERLRVLAAGLPGAVMAERVLDAPFEEAWGFLSDLELSVPAFDRSVSRLRVVRSEVGPDVERLRAHVWSGRIPVPLPLDVELRPGWGWMVSRPTLHVVGMAAEPAGDRTRYAQLEATALSGPRPLQSALRPALALARAFLTRHVRSDLDGIEAALATHHPRP